MTVDEPKIEPPLPDKVEPPLPDKVEPPLPDKVELPLPERVREPEPLALAELNRQLGEAIADARTAEHWVRELQTEARAAVERTRLLRRQIRDEERRLRRVSYSRSLGRTVSGGILGGAGAGAIFALFVMLMDTISGDNIFDWLHYRAAIVLGRSTLPNDSPKVLLVGLFVHLTLAALYGAIFAVAARYIALLRAHLITATAVFGLGIWMVNFYLFSPLLFPWFGNNIVVVQFIAHTLFFGVPLGIILLEFTPTGGILGRNPARL